MLDLGRRLTPRALEDGLIVTSKEDTTDLDQIDTHNKNRKNINEGYERLMKGGGGWGPKSLQSQSPIIQT